MEGVLRFIINIRLQYAFQYVKSNRSVKAVDWHKNLSIVLKYKLESIMIKEYRNVRKRTKKSIGGLPNNKGCIVKK